MVEKVVDLISYKIEKSLKEHGFTVKRDKGKKIKLLIKINEEDL